MVSKFIRIGHSAAVTIPKKILLKMAVKIGGKVNVTYFPEPNEIVIRPLMRKKRQSIDRVARLTLNFIDQYRSALKELAKWWHETIHPN